MTFWDFSISNPDAPALLLGSSSDSVRSVSYRELAAAADAFWELLGKSAYKRLGIILCRNTPETHYAYLAALRGRDAVMLLNEQTNPISLQAIYDSYRPDWVFRPAETAVPDFYRSDAVENGWQLLRREQVSSEASLCPDLAVLLSTSGTTGSPKMVRLSYGNIESNAQSIVNYLEIDAEQRAITTLPFNYSYGMSVANSHFCAGAALVLTEQGIPSRDFWDTFACHDVTSLAGVPYTYQMLHRLNPRKLPLVSLRTLTQAGGALSLHLVDYYKELSDEMGWRFFVMYGQTEAAPRISYVPPSMLAAKRGSIGIAIPGGTLSLSQDGELIYDGANVMMGYGLCREDLANGDELGGRLATGDLATQDEDGYFFLHGRLRRFIKIYGNRVSLDDIEQRLEAELQYPVAAVGEDDKVHIFLGSKTAHETARSILTSQFHLHPTTFNMHGLDVIPYTLSGKKDYARLRP
jgi:long-chain acyl-CoA synthetase